jgi:2-polyprenyl-6-hydroxyphenyl methylase / 3-demethylubiquinone-9 3-methyltransferase
MLARSVMSNAATSSLRLALPRAQTPRPYPTTALRTRKSTTSVDEGEVAKFNVQAAKWWDPNGYAAPLHRMNPVRIAFIRAAIERRRAEVAGAAADDSAAALAAQKPLSGVSIVDVGCGGGLVTEPLARLGADVLGVDMSVEGVSVARAHAARDPFFKAGGRLRYEVRAVEDLVAESAGFDTVLALEVVEHVAKPEEFLRNCAAVVKPGGLLVLSTLNRTVASYALGIVAAERILRWLPEGTHNWSRFPTPHEVSLALEVDGGMVCDEVAGMSFNLFRNSFYLSEDTSVNYIMTAVKPLVPDVAAGDVHLRPR